MNILIEIVKIVLPAALVIYGMYLTVRVALRKIATEIIPATADSKETLLRIRLQAFERLCLFLERISPENLILRMHTPGIAPQEFEKVLLNEIRNEFNHNLSQQVYMSDAVWQSAKNAKNEVIQTIQQAFSKTTDSNTVPAVQLFKIWDAKPANPIHDALTQLKAEARKLYE